MKYLKLLLILCAILPFVVNAQSSSSGQVNLIVSGCNNNGICEPMIGESTSTCPLDCTGIPSPSPTPSPSPSSSASPSPTSSPTPSHTPNPTQSSSPSSNSPSINAPTAQSQTTSPPLYISKILLQQTEGTVTISWITTNTTLSSLVWGSTPDYEMGSVGGAIYETEHSITVPGLEPATQYYFHITAKDLYGNQLNYSGQFTTVPLVNYNPPSNITNISIGSSTNSIFIRWTNPPDKNFAGVRIVRSPYNYPTDQNDGRVVYEGSGNSVSDSSIDLNKNYYYSAFSYDSNYNYSSGTLFKYNKSDFSSPIDFTTSTSTLLSFSNLTFIQGGKIIIVNNGSVVLDNQQKLIVSLNNNFPDKISTACITLDIPNGGSCYMLRQNSTTNAYQAQIDLSNLQSGTYSFTISGIFENQKLSTFSLSGRFIIASSTKLQSSISPTIIITITLISSLILLILIKIIYLFF